VVYAQWPPSGPATPNILQILQFQPSVRATALPLSRFTTGDTLTAGVRDEIAGPGITLSNPIVLLPNVPAVSVRQELASVIAAAIASTYPSVQVYDHPEDVTQLPAVVIVPDDPWCEPSTFGAVRWRFQVSLMVHRSPVESSVVTMEGLRPLIAEAIAPLGGTWQGLSRPDTVEMAGVQVLMADMAISLITGGQT
jgi:hypothetical protein